MMKHHTRHPSLGFGLGLRTEHYDTILATKPAVDWFEIISENYLVPGGKPLYYLERIRQDYPMVMHGVSMSIGSSDPLDLHYLQQIKTLAARVEPAWISDHLCWTGVHGLNMHDLLPLPYTEDTIRHVVARIQQVQDILGRQLVIENVSSYAAFSASCMDEWTFITEICQRADCLLLLDINNIYVSSINHGFDAKAFVDGVPAQRVQQLHLAGHEDHGDYIIDTHDADIAPGVWALYSYALQQLGHVSTMIERDGNIPPIETLLQELHQARALSTQMAIQP